MKVSYFLLISLLIVGTLFIPAVSAEIIIDEDIYYAEDTSVSIGPVTATVAGTSRPFNTLILTDTELRQNLVYVGITMEGDRRPGGMQEGRNVVRYTFNGYTDTAIVYYTLQRNFLGQITKTQIQVFFENWDAEGLIGRHSIKFNTSIFSNKEGYPAQDAPHAYWRGGDSGAIKNCRVLGTVVASYIDYKNHLLVESEDNLYRIKLTRDFNGIVSPSRYEVLKDSTTVLYNEGITNLEMVYLKSEITDIRVIFADKSFTYPLGTIDPGDPGDPGDSPTLTVYIKNSQTGALIANSNIVIDALVDGEYYPVVNRSEPSGILSIDLQPTGGGPPNPDGYRLIVTADGYNNPMPEINFTVDDYKQSIYCLLDPISGGPADENKTFIDFFVSDMYANPVPGASVKFGKYTLITNSAGYTVFEVPKNDYYTYTVSKSGYNTITGNVNIGDAPRNTVNTYLTLVTTPPTQPPDWPTTPTPPTGGIPDEDDDSDGFLVQAVRGIGLAFGVGFSTAKIIFGMLLALSIGFTTAKKLRGGAAEFGIGLLGGTILGVLIGLLPVWIIVVLLLVVGLYVGNRYVGGNNFG